MSTVIESLPDRASPTAPLAFARRLSALARWEAVVVLAAIVGSLFVSIGAFTFDEAIYVQMAGAMAGEGRWTFEQIHLAGADSLSLRYAYPAPDGRLTPQYPFSYGLLAGPFYAAFGVRGLFLMNALAGAVGIILVHRIATAMRLGGRAAALSAVLFGAASIAATYYFAIWPHMATTALALAALLAAISAEADGASVAARLRRGAMAGALIGAAMTARVDTVLAVIAILVWQRAFIGGARAPTVGFLAGLAPVLIAAAAVNHQKFGVFNPLTYQSENGGGSIAAFAVPLAAAGGALAVLMVVDAQGVRARLVRFAQSAPRAFAATAASIAAAALFIFSDQAARLAHGALLLIVDMRAGNYAGIHGVTHNAWGMPLFFDLNKRALLQSMPFAPLALVGLARFLRGRGARGEGLLWLVAGAFITFYALSKWHGGMSLNMRYYLPAAAALSILCAASLARFSAFACDVDRRTAIRGFTAFIAVFCFTWTGGPLADALSVYPALAPAAAVFILSCALALQPSRALARAWRLSACAAVGASVALNLGDLLRDQKFRQYTAVRDAAFADYFPDGALIATSKIAQFAGAMTDQLSIIYPGLDAPERTARVIEAHQAAGRCVYFQAEMADWAAKAPGLSAQPIVDAPNAYIAEGAFSALRANPDHCPG